MVSPVISGAQRWYFVPGIWTYRAGVTSSSAYIPEP